MGIHTLKIWARSGDSEILDNTEPGITHQKSSPLPGAPRLPGQGMYTAVVRPAMTCGSTVWHPPYWLKGVLKSVENRLSLAKKKKAKPMDYFGGIKLRLLWS